MVDVADRVEAEAPDELAEPGETDASLASTNDVTDRAERLAGGDPRQAVVDLLHRRLDARLRPLGELMDATDRTWHDLYVLTRRDLEEVLQDDLPPASDFYGSITTPGEVYVDALCPVCGIATEIVLGVDRELITHGNGSSELKLATKSKSRPHQHGQLRTRDVPVPGQVIAPFGEAQEAANNIGADSTEADVAEFDREVAAIETAEPLDLGACPFPGCLLVAEHPGKHAINFATIRLGDVPAGDDDLDLLPTP